MNQKTFDFEPQFFVIPAGFREVRGAGGGVAPASRVIDRFETLPTVKVHYCHQMLTQAGGRPAMALLWSRAAARASPTGRSDQAI
jgi:hypothetical protein